MKCKTVLAKLAALLDGELNAAIEAQVRSHLEVCAGCSETAAQIARLGQLAGAWTPSGSDVWEQVRGEIEAPNAEALASSLRALEAEVRALRAEVADLRAQAAWSERGAHLGAIGPIPRPAALRQCLRIV